MKNLKIWQKLALLAAVFMLPFLMVTATLLKTVEEQADFARGELVGLDFAVPLLHLSDDLRQHRALAARVIAGEDFKSQLDASAAELQNDLRAIDDVYAKPQGELYNPKRYEVLRTGVRDLLANGQTSNAEASYAAHTQLVSDSKDLVAEVGDVSQLILDPQLDSYYLMSALMMQGPELSEYLAQARIFARSGTSGAGSAERMDRLRGLAALTEASERNLNDSLLKAIAADPSLKPKLMPRAEAVTNEVRQTHEAISRLSALQSGAAVASSAGAIEPTEAGALQQLQATLVPALAASLNKRVEVNQHQLKVTFGWTGLAMLTVLVIGFFIVRDVTGPLKQVVGVANQIAVGNLNVEPISAGRKDEIGVLARAFDRMIMSLREQVLLVQDIADGDLRGSIKPQSANDDMGNALAEMLEHLSGLVSEVHKSGIQVNTSATQISATAREQHSTATEIAATTTEIGATSKEISATSKELVRTMTEVADAAEQSATLAGSGQAGLTQMEETMHRVMEATGSINAKLAVLNEKAGNITQVVTTITRVADQTNLLSLNAAIEAEKAGEYGRGFSVVATEIRRLADQTAVATYDIEQMVKEIQSAVSAGVMGMDKFSEEVRRGMDEVQQVGSQLSQIIHQVQQMAPRCEAASEGMRAQATGAEQITQALSQLSEAALQTVESLRQSNQAIDGLHQSATGLREGVSRFKLGG
jgi:methyl-accepting chemotaxis protein WspA